MSKLKKKKFKRLSFRLENLSQNKLQIKNSILKENINHLINCFYGIFSIIDK